MANVEQLLSVLENNNELLKKTQINIKKCAKARLTKGYLQTRMECIESYWKTYKSAHLDLIKITPREQKSILPYFVNEDYYLIEDLYLCMVSDIKDMLEGLEIQRGQQSCNQGNGSTAVEHNVQSQVRLPRIELPTFSGNYEEWPSYKDIFVALVHDNTSLSNVQRLHYLKCSITGEAASLLKHIQITESNYLSAWETLKHRYGNKRMIINSLFKRLFSQKKIMSQSALQLKGILDTTNEVLNSLQNLKVSTESWDPIIVFLVVQRLDPDTHKEWEQFSYDMSQEELSTWFELQKFLEGKFRTLELLNPLFKSTLKPLRERVFHMSIEKTCIMCKENHSLCRCKTFSKMSPAERSHYAQHNKLCFNCLAPGHSAFRCNLPLSCRICKARHHSLLHQSTKANASASLELKQPMTLPQEEEKTLATMTALHNVTEHINLLATAIVVIKGNYGHTTVLRALIDSGSQSCFITQKATQALKLQRKPVNLVVTGMDNMKVNIKQEVNFDLLSRWETNFELPIHAYVMSQPLKFNIPSSEYLQQELRHFEKLNLADPNFMDSGALDLLLGVQEYTAILKQGLIKGPSGTICAQKTSLGWIVMGGININMKPKHKAIMAMNITTDASFNDLIKTIWEIDTDTKRNLTKEELRCEEFYKETHARNDEGRYIVRLPFKTEAPLSSEGNTKETAIKRLMQLERRFSRNPELKDEYLKVINEYKTLNHIEEVPEKELHKKSVYLPHHAVVRQDKETTKTRVVFDASCKGSNNISLNEELLSGPVLQEDLRNLIMRWRIHAICFVSDIQMMYRMIKIHRDDVDYQRIVWRENPSDEIRDYRLLTVTFGTASAPYLAVKTLKQLAIDEGDKFPEAARILNEDFYVDDCMSGSDDVQKAIQISKDLKELLRRGGFELKKWSSNNTEFMQSLKPDERTTKAHFDLKLDGIIKALGVQWNLGNDRFEYNLDLPEVDEENIITKRNILSDIQKLFDPLGWIAPSIVQAKILIQKLWLEKVDWDEDLNIFLKEEWLKIRRDLMNVNNISIDRWLSTSCSNMDTIKIHGYCDASILAYAAVVYCLVKKTDGSCRTSLIAARTRVAPLKTISLPKLELFGALLLSRLLNQVAQAMRIPMERVFAWTDSSIVIAWLSGEPTKWKPFVANRVVEILANHKKEQWHHVQSQENPADIASRGMFISDLKHCDLWWKGPTWLQKGEIILTDENIFTTDLEKKKERIKTLILTNIKEEKRFSEKFERFTTLNELLRTIAFCKKFIKFKKDNKNITITTEDIEEALLTCIKIVQNEEFETEIDSLKKENNIKKNSKLKTLNPFLDNNGVLRVGGRLAKSSLETNTKHPIIIGNNNTLVSLIIADAHKRTLHGGIQLMLCYLRSKYWVLRAKDMTKKHIHRCLICAKESAKVKTQLMGDLPSVRTTPSRPFINAGVDFAGPFQILMNKGRGIKTNKAYTAIFVCMSTKAIHLELVGDMTSNSFIAAYRRFTSRRGKCAHLWSDQGKNFVGANKELCKAWEEAKLQFDQEIIDSLANDGTQWHFIPAYSPNFGGLWEAGVKSMKYHLKRILNNNLTFEELSTVLCEIEACLNSRPLCHISQADDTLDPLTPGHFLIGEAPIVVPHPKLNDIKISHLARWQYTQKLLNDFWCRWQNEYVTNLQQRPKWLKRIEEFKIGDIVLIKQQNLPPGKWILGRITEKHPGSDGVTRVYSVKNGNNIVKRSVSNLCYLPINEA